MHRTKGKRKNAKRKPKGTVNVSSVFFCISLISSVIVQTFLQGDNIIGFTTLHWSFERYCHNNSDNCNDFARVIMWHRLPHKRWGNCHFIRMIKTINLPKW